MTIIWQKDSLDLQFLVCLCFQWSIQSPSYCCLEKTQLFVLLVARHWWNVLEYPRLSVWYIVLVVDVVSTTFKMSPLGFPIKTTHFVFVWNPTHDDD